MLTGDINIDLNFLHANISDVGYLYAAIKFLILGTLGEYLGAVIRQKNYKPFPLWKILPKAVIWAFLGVIIKWSFSTFTTLVEVQTLVGLLPVSFGIPGTILYSFTVSVEMNLFFGPFLMLSHRIFDNILDRKWEFNGIEIALYALIWFWIPIHTITFLLPDKFRIIFAAMLSVVLGVILGFAKRKY